ncbi:MAG: hypothetical protein JSS91_09830 [Bacteroidetes bacterium]|nr:hypothetical protein [Bacteroidota bacterium]
MKNLLAVFILTVIFSGSLSAQYKGYDDKGPNYKTNSSNLLLGFINPNNFTMHHSFNVSMINTGSGNVSLTSYINSMNYRISDKLNISADVKFQYSPYASSIYGPNAASSLQKDLSGVSLSRASLNYRISENSFINVEFRKIDQSDFYYNNNFYNPFISNPRYSGY